MPSSGNQPDSMPNSTSGCEPGTRSHEHRHRAGNHAARPAAQTTPRDTTPSGAPGSAPSQAGISTGEPSQQHTATGATHVRDAARPAPNTSPETNPDHISSTEERKPLLVIVGPTAVGKTSLAILLAQSLNGEIISADSRQVYREMDIGTAKPSPAERQTVPHHLLDIVSPADSFTLAEYQDAANQTIAAIHARDRLPMLVGGTGQYITAVIEGWGIPRVPPNPARRAELEQFAADHGSEALHARLADRDPDAAARIDHRNIRRVVRALEVCLETGTPISVLQRRQPPPYRILQLGLTLPRVDLYARIDARVEQMIQQGLLDEVRALLDAGYTWDYPAMSSLGYIQWRPYLAGEATLEETISAIQNATHAFARRQYTWFRGHDSGIQWIDAHEIEPKIVMALITDWLRTEGK